MGKSERRIAPAAVRFVSLEPLLGPIDLAIVPNRPLRGLGLGSSAWPGLDWVIIGGESGSGARPCDMAWIRSIVEQCQAASVPVFVKQDSGPRPGMQGRIPDEFWLKEFPR